jgi:hypothetical protein
VEEPQREYRSERGKTDEQRGPVNVPEAAYPRAQLLPRGVTVRGGYRQLRQLAYRHIHGSAGQKAGHYCLGEKLSDPPHPKQGEQEEQHARNQGDPGHELGSRRS